MSYAPRPTLPSHLRPGSTASNPPTNSGAAGPSSAAIQATSVTLGAGGSGSLGASPLLQQRIAGKKAELASLKELQALSAGLAAQMQQLEAKLGTLADGTEAVAAVLSNWHNVLRAVNMASSAMAISKPRATDTDVNADETDAQGKQAEREPLPVTLVRIPTEQVGLLPQGVATSAADPAG